MHRQRPVWLRPLAPPVLTLLVAGLVLLPTPPASQAAELPVGWSQAASLPTSFSPRWDFAYAYFPPDDEVVLFGGAPKGFGESWKRDTWIHDGSSWKLGPAAPAGLTARGGAAMAYHPGLKKLVLFGGAGSAWPPLNDTWLWNGDKWTMGPAAPSGLTGRTGAQMAYHPGIDKLVLFGGSGVLPYRDTWLFDGTKWTKGPTTPAAMSSRVYFGMTYDAAVGKIYLAGGNGKADGWYFTGSQWQAGPPLAAGPRERFRMDYDPQLDGTVMYGGIGPGVSHDDVWLLRDGEWSQILKWSGKPWPEGGRIDGAVLWHPTKGALMLFSGIVAKDAGVAGLKDTWFFNHVAPKVEYVTLEPTDPSPNKAIVLKKGPVQDGYRNWYYEYRWFKNGVLIPGNTDPKLEPEEGGYQAGDEIKAKVRVHDHIDIYGPWVTSNVVEIQAPAPGEEPEPDSDSRSDGSLPGPPVGPSRGPRPGSSGGQPLEAVEGGVVVPEGPASPDSPGSDGPIGEATGQPTAHDGKFWLGTQQIVLKGMNVHNQIPDEDDLELMASWGMNVIRYHFQWSEVEAVPPTPKVGGGWTHHWDTEYVQDYKDFVALAQSKGLYTIVDNHGCGDCGMYFSFPDWLYTKHYNSHGKTYAKTEEGIDEAAADFWTDDLRQQFMLDMWNYVAPQLATEDGIAGYEVLNEPKIGNLPAEHDTTAMVLDFELELAKKVRSKDPDRIIFFTTRAGFGPGVLVADLSGFEELGNVAFDLHDYFGARWGNGYGGEKEEEPNYQEVIQLLYNHVLSDNPFPPYFGTAWGHVEFVGGVYERVKSYGMPLLVGEVGDYGTDPGVYHYFGAMMGAMAYLGTSWTICAFGGDLGIMNSDGSLRPYAPIVINAV